MNDGHILGSQHLVDSMLLCGVQIRKAHVGKREGLGLLLGIEKVAQIGQTPFGAHCPVECFEHQAIGGLVEEELDA